MAQTYLTNTNPTAGNRTKGTVSVWVKRSGLSSTQYIYSELYDTNNFGGIRFNSADTLGVFSYDSGSAQMDINTTRKFRDTNGWYHIVVAWDTTDGTSTDRIKIYVNGVRETSFTGSPTYPSSSQNLYFGVGGTSYPIVIGRRGDNAEYFDGSMSHFHRVDNQALAQTVFGSTDSTTGEWKISVSPSITYTGSSDYNFFILKDGNSVTDQSGQSNNLTVGYGTLTKTEDCPSNVFATFNSLVKNSNITFSEGNNSVVASDANYRVALGNLGANSGKFYAEFKAVSGFSGADKGVGIFKMSQAYSETTGLGNFSGGYTWQYAATGNVRTNNATSDTEATFTDGDIIGIAMDLDNNKLYFHKNGTYINSGVPTSGSTGTGAYAISNSDNEFYTFAATVISSGGANKWSANFGNGYFGTTAVSSAGTNASGVGIFEYDVPTGYTALSTKGLNE